MKGKRSGPTSPSRYILFPTNREDMLTIALWRKVRCYRCARLVTFFALGWYFSCQPCAANLPSRGVRGIFRAQGWRIFNQPCALQANLAQKKPPTLRTRLCSQDTPVTAYPWPFPTALRSRRTPDPPLQPRRHVGHPGP